MSYPENKNIDEAIRQKMKESDVYETYMHKIYNIIVLQTNEQLQEKEASDTTLQAVKSSRYTMG